MNKLYNYCTDFIINMANLLDLSYYEINAFLFCFLYPILVISLIVLFIFQKRKLNRLRKNSLSCLFIVINLLLITSCSNSSTKAPSSPVFSKTQTALETRSPLHTSIDNGQIWVSSSDGLPMDIDVNCIVRLGFELLIGTEKSGLFMSEGDRISWKSIGGKLPSQKIKNIEVVDNQNIIVVFSNGIYTTLDLGRSWIDMTYNLKDENVMDILLFNENIFAGADYGIYQLKNKKWKQVHRSGQVNCLKHYNGKIFAGSVKGLLQSDDNGATWTTTHNEGTIHNIAIVNGKIVLMYLSGDVYVSADFGETWKKALYNQIRTSYVYDAAAIDDVMLMSNNDGIHQSKDGGLSWQFLYSQKDDFFNDFLVVDKLIYGVTKQK